MPHFFVHFKLLVPESRGSFATREEAEEEAEWLRADFKERGHGVEVLESVRIEERREE